MACVCEIQPGTLIVFEGCDGSGKTTQAIRLVERLQAKGVRAEFMSFPDRTTPIGSVIDDYLNKRIELDPEAAHLLFSANRWEKIGSILRKLESGTTLVLDRYAFSGVAYTMAKGLQMQWCKRPDTGLPAPHLLIHLDVHPDELAKRQGPASERYETGHYQKRVRECYMDLYKELTCVQPNIIDATALSVEELADIIEPLALAKEYEFEKLDQFLW